MTEAQLTKVYELSAIRRGRRSTTPIWIVTTPSSERWAFQRKKDAQAFIDAGCVCPNHESFACCHCRGRKHAYPVDTQ